MKLAPDDENLVIRMARTARSGPYQDRGDRLLQEIMVPNYSPVTVAKWIIDRLRSGISSATVAQDLSAARLAASRTNPLYLAALNDPLVTDVLNGGRRLEGPPPLTRGATPMSLLEYRHLLTRGPMVCRQALALCWLRAARTADVLALKRGSLWMRGKLLVIELGREKCKALGIPGFVEVLLPETEKLILSTLISVGPPVTRPMKRLPLLPLTYAAFHAYILTHRPRNSTVTPHSLRKGSIQQMIRAGIPLKDVALLSQHRSVEGLMPYVSMMDRDTQSRMHSASLALLGARAPTGRASSR